MVLPNAATAESRGQSWNETHSERAALYGQGLTDTEIAKIQGVDRSAIRCWRKSHGFSSNSAKRNSEAKVRRSDRADMYRRGMTDAQIAKVQGVHRCTVKKWRRDLGLPVNRARRDVNLPELLAAREFLYESGLRDVEIARQQGLSTDAIFSWRRYRGLPANRSDRTRARPRKLAVDISASRLLERIRKAVGPSLPADIRDEAISDMYIDLSVRKLCPADIEKMARTYGNRVLDRFASKFGPRSLDQEIGEDGFTLLDTLIDDSSSSWLEEMGATVW